MMNSAGLRLLNVESKITDWLTVGLNSSYSFQGLFRNGGQSWQMPEHAVLWQIIRLVLPNYDMYLTGEAYMPISS